MIKENLIHQCKEKLLQTKMDLLNRVPDCRNDLVNSGGRGGDEADQTVAILQENGALISYERLKSQLLEIESALSRIENGSYGVCEETEEFIEPDRLLAIPWTRLSIEGAELREELNKRYAR